MDLVALVGLAGSGKTEASNIFREHGYGYIRFGDITMDILKERGLEVNEKNERAVREGVRREYGMAAYAVLNEGKIREARELGDVVIDGVYSWEEVLHLKDRFAEIQIVAVVCPMETKYERLEKRPERPLTREEALSRDLADIKNLNKAPPIVMHDYLINNKGSRRYFRYQVENFIQPKNKLERIYNEVLEILTG